MGIQETFITKISRPSPLLIAGTAATAFIVTPAIRLTFLSRRLSKQISHHRTLTGDSARALLNGSLDSTSQPSDTDARHDATEPHNALTRSDHRPPTTPTPAALPTTLSIAPESHNIFYDISLLHIPSSTLPSGLLQRPHDLLTAYLQHTMTLFASTPQAWILWAIAALSGDQQGRRSFEREWIESLGFEKGELVNGLYFVVERGSAVEGDVVDVDDRDGEGGAEGARVVFEMKRGAVEGRLVVSVRDMGYDLGRRLEVAEAADVKQSGVDDGQDESSTVVFSTETWMWVSKDANVVMPMERAVPRFMHRMGSGWLLLEGTKWLQNLGR